MLELLIRFRLTATEGRLDACVVYMQIGTAGVAIMESANKELGPGTQRARPYGYYRFVYMFFSVFLWCMTQSTIRVGPIDFASLGPWRLNYAEAGEGNAARV